MLSPNHQTLACCAFPTRVMVVDDQPAIIDSLRFALQVPLEIATDSIQALNRLSVYQPTVTDALWLNLDETSDAWDGVHKQPTLMDVKNILSIADMPERSNDISVVIVDYQMPGMDGLTLLNHLADKPFKKILLTGEGRDTMAVQAFNDGLIDYFLQKDDVALEQKLKDAITQLQQQYFMDMSKKTLDFLKQTAPMFTHSAAASFFYDKINQMNVSEFYMLDMNGSYLLKTNAGEQKYFLIHSAAYIDMIAEHGKTDKVVPSIIHAIQEKKVFPYFGEHKTYWQVSGKDWEQYLQPLTEVNFGKQSYYVAVF